jgi:hypothetical protein
MGSSKSFRKGPGWQGVNTNRGPESPYSKGNVVNPEGTFISGGETGRSGMSKKARDKSSSSRKGGPTKY